MSRKYLLPGAAVALAMIATPLTAGPAFAAPAQAEAATTVYYDTSDAPTFRAQINAGAAVRSFFTNRRPLLRPVSLNRPGRSVASSSLAA